MFGGLFVLFSLKGHAVIHSQTFTQASLQQEGSHSCQRDLHSVRGAASLSLPDRLTPHIQTTKQEWIRCNPENILDLDKILFHNEITFQGVNYAQIKRCGD